MKACSQKIVIISGLLFFLIGITINEWMLGITNIILRAIIFSFDLLFISAGILIIEYKQRILREIGLLFVTLLCLFAIIEGYYRIFDPFPYFGQWEINHTEHGNLSRYDEMLGWSGVPNGKEEFVTSNNKILLQNNHLGFRDVEHSASKKPAIVFLGDSFTWGYEVEFNEMFVNKLRKKLPDYEIFNLAHRGYGTDQELLTFKQWKYNKGIKLVILMFYKNDFRENNATVIYDKQKPKYELHDDNLFLTNVPVPRDKRWQPRNDVRKKQPSLKDHLKWLVFRSHFIHDISLRATHIKKFKETDSLTNEEVMKIKEDNEYVLTKRIINELNKEVAKRGARLIIVAIPSKCQFIDDGICMPSNCPLIYKGKCMPYQLLVEKICNGLKIDYLDLGPYFKKSHLKIYVRLGMHINKYGNTIIMNAIYEYLTKFYI